MSERDAYSLKARVIALLSIDLRSLAAMRIFGALTMLWCLCVWAPDLTAYFTDDGLLKRSDFAGRFDWARFSVLRYVDGWWAAIALWIVGVISGICLLIGFRSRLAAFVCWLAYLSFAGRNPMILQGGDVLLPLLLFWMTFLPVGAVYSIDAALDPVSRRGERHISVATVGLLLQVLYVYVFGALLKTGAAWIPDGSAIYIALHIDSFVTPIGKLLREQLITMQVLTFFVYFLELFAPVLLFFPDKRQFVRMVALALIWMMHLGFRTFLHIGHFWLASLTSLCAYIPSRVWNWIGRWYFSEDQRGVRIYYDRDCGFCLKIALILREFFLPRSIPITPAQDDPVIGEVLEREVSWVVIDAAGAQRLRWDAVAYVMSQSRVLKPLGWLATAYGLIGLGDPTYKLIGDSRRGLGAITSRLLKPVATVPRLSLATTIALSAVIAFCFLWNVNNLGGAFQPLAAMDGLNRMAQKAGFTQRWQMFAPNPPTTDGFPVFEAVLSNGSTEDVFSDPPRPLSFETPNDVVGLFGGARRRAFVLNAWIMERGDRTMFFTRMAQARCDDLNDMRPAERQITKIVVHFVENETKSNFDEEIRRYRVLETECG